MNCKICGSKNIVIMDFSFMICNDCGCQLKTMVFTSFDDKNNYIKKTVFYKRLNYLNEIILSINGVYNYDDVDVIHKLKKTLNENNKSVNFSNIKKIWQKLKIKLSYKQIHSIINKILELNNPINYKLKERIIYVFNEFEIYYKKNAIKNRKKLIWYVYLLDKIFKKLGCNHLKIFLRYPLISKHKETKRMWN